jgi:hypothetical protein
MIHLVVTLDGEMRRNWCGTVENQAAKLSRDDERLQFCSSDREAE